MHRVGLLISDHFQVLGLSTLSIFEFANQVAGEPFYDCTVYSEYGGSVKSSYGFGVDSQPIAADIKVDPRFYVSTSKSIIKALINMHSFEIQLSPIG